jgi:hypothetical protein
MNLFVVLVLNLLLLMMLSLVVFHKYDSFTHSLVMHHAPTDAQLVGWLVGLMNRLVLNQVTLVDQLYYHHKHCQLVYPALRKNELIALVN